MRSQESGIPASLRRKTGEIERMTELGTPLELRKIRCQPGSGPGTKSMHAREAYAGRSEFGRRNS